MRLVVVVAVLMLGSSAPANASGKDAPLTAYDLVANFGDAKQLAAARIYDGLFNALQPILGGTAPRLRYVDNVGSDDFHARADIPGNAIDIDNLTLAALIDEKSAQHSGAVNVLPHELAHMRQTGMTLAQALTREGGAQAFADEVTPTAAFRAGTYYDAGRNYDGAYRQYADEARKRGREWLLGGQFGKSAPAWP